MLDTTRARLKSMYDGEPQPGTDGTLHAINPMVRIGDNQGTFIADLHRGLRPELSVEIGFAYGFSTLHILDAMAEDGYGHHIAIDPAEESMWHGVGLQAVRDLGLTERFEFIPKRAFAALSQLLREDRHPEFVFIDGSHLFDYALADFRFVDEVLKPGGHILFDDLWMPSIQKLKRFIETNLDYYEVIETRRDDNFLIRHARKDDRDWQHFVDF